MASAGNLGPKAEVRVASKKGRQASKEKKRETCNLRGSYKRLFREGRCLRLAALSQVVKAKVLVEVVQRLKLLLC